MILHCNFEELRALVGAGEMLLDRTAVDDSVTVARRAAVEQALPRFTGDVSVETLHDQRRLRAGIGTIVQDLHRRLDEQITEFGAGHEDSVNTYFDYAHARGALAKLDMMGAEMEAIIELIGGRDADAQVAAGITFPD